MLWRNRRESGNIVDRRSMKGGLGLGGLILGAVVYYMMGGNPLYYLAQNSGSIQREEAETPSRDDQKKYVGVILADTEDVWHDLFKDEGLKYQEPKLVLFRDSVSSACGQAGSSVGPFYCPGDQQVYLDLNFFQYMAENFKLQGDFPIAYVIAHEVGHHVQNLLGIDKSARAHSEGMGKVGKNKMSVQIELQADCLAGIWAKQTQVTKNVLEDGDIEEALGAASAVGDDRVMHASGKEVVPDSFTHGSALQRAEAFKLGYVTGGMKSCLSAYR